MPSVAQHVEHARSPYALLIQPLAACNYGFETVTINAGGKGAVWALLGSNQALTNYEFAALPLC